jgi:hypothetical protein
MKTTTKGIWILLLFPLLFGMVQAQSAQSGALSLANVAVMPNPIVAGKNMTVTFQLYNSYNQGLNDVDLQLTGAYPILNFSPLNSYLISVMGTGLYAGFFTYTIALPQTTPSGTYSVNFLASYQTTSITTGGVIGTSSMPLTFYVHGVPNVTATVTNVQVLSSNEISVGVQIANTGYTEAKNVNIDFLNTSGTSIAGNNKVQISELNSGSTLSSVVYYTVSGGSVGSSAYTVPMSISFSSDYNTTYSKRLNLTASLAVNKPDLVVMLSNPQPQSLYQGRNQSLTLQIDNIGTGAADNVTVSLVPGKGINLLSSLNSFFIGEIAPGQVVTEPVLIAANGTSGTSITANLQYFTSSYQSEVSKTQRLNLSLAPSAQFAIEAQTSSLNPGATATPVTFQIKNTGTIEADQVELNIQTTYPITPVASTYYIAALAPGATENATFIVSADSQGVPGNYPVTIFEQWKQPNGAVNQQFSGSNNYFVQVGGGGGSNTLLIVVVVIVVAAVGFYMYRKRAAAKKADKSKK